MMEQVRDGNQLLEMEYKVAQDAGRTQVSAQQGPKQTRSQDE
jgi:hypothetical protein